MIRPYLVEEVTVDVAGVSSAALQELAELLAEVADATQPAGRPTAAARMLAELASQLDDVLLWRAVRGDLLERDVGG